MENEVELSYSAEYPASWSKGDGMVHSGEKCIRKDFTSDWPWADCGARLVDMHWIAAPVNCLWCTTGQDLGPHDPPIGT